MRLTGIRQLGYCVKKIFEWIIWLLILAVFGLWGVNRLINALVHSKAERVVPNLVGKNIIDGLSMASSVNIYLQKTGDDFNSRIPAGLIISQIPLPGSIVREGKVIKVIVSAGGEVVYVPKLENETVRSAQMILRKSMLDLGEQSEKYSLEIEKGKIISQDPAVNSPFQKNGLVNIVVSVGLPPEGMLIVPSFTGKSFVDAEDWANQNGIAVANINKVNDLKYPVNTVIKQSPEYGCAIDRNTGMELWVSSSTE